MRITRVFVSLSAALVLVLAIAPAAETPASAQSKTITLSMLAGYKEDVLRANLPEFEKKTGIKVVVDAAPFGDLYKKQLLSLSTGGRYDVLFMDEPWIPPLSEFLLPLNERMKALDTADFIPTTVASARSTARSTRCRWIRTSSCSSTARTS